MSSAFCSILSRMGSEGRWWEGAAMDDEEGPAVEEEEAVLVVERWKLKEPAAPPLGAGPTPAALLPLKRGVLYRRAVVAALLPMPPGPAPPMLRPSVSRNGVSSNVYSGRPCGIA
jgi:hypothetical protein